MKAKTLKRFLVQGWALDPETKKRIGLRKTVITAVNGKAAAFTYARCEGIKTSWWYEVGPSPRIVIRVEDAPVMVAQPQRQRRAA
jgi:hypothetical protein